MRLSALLLAAAAGAATGAGAAEPGVRVHGTQHRGVGRLVFDVAPGLRWHESTQGDAVVLRFDAPAPMRPPAALPRNVLALDEDGDGAVTAVDRTLQPDFRKDIVDRGRCSLIVPDHLDQMPSEA